MNRRGLVLLGLSALMSAGLGCSSDNESSTSTTGRHTTGHAAAASVGAATSSTGVGGTTGATGTTGGTTAAMSTSSTSSSGSTTGGGTCNPNDLDPNTIALGYPCAGASDPNCACPYICAGPGGSFVCTATCKVASDCPASYEACFSGLCVVRQCGPGTGNGNFDGPCAVDVNEPGTCLPTEGIGVCFANGPYTGNGCDPYHVLWDGGCAGGEECQLLPDSGGGCLTVCDPATASTCESGICFQTQDPSEMVNPDFGVCVAAPWTCVSPNEYDVALPFGFACAGPTDNSCGCPLGCFPAPGGAYTCTNTCATAADCPHGNQRCQGGGCVLALCGLDDAGQQLEGAYDGPCEVDTGIPGTCIPSTDSNSAPIGVCVAIGTVTGACDPAFGKDSGTCVAGDDCFYPDILNLTGTCQALCNPLVDGGGCATGTYCLNPLPASQPNPSYGFCYPTQACEPFAVATPCSAVSPCPCGLTCASDPATGTTDCQQPCSDTSGCVDQHSTCVNGSCAPIPCSVPDGPCDYSAVGAHDGTCGPLWSDQLGQAVGFACDKAGPSTTSCDGGSSYDQCAPGLECIVNYAPNDAGMYVSAGTCTQLCNPDSGMPGCPGGGGCLAAYGPSFPVYGFCCPLCI